MSSDIEKDIFKRGSSTYYFSTRFFPGNVRDDIVRLYSFVRTADDYVDCIPQNVKEFQALWGLWDDAIADGSFNTDRDPEDTLNQRVVKNMVYLTRKYDFDVDWIESFFQSMQADIEKKSYATLDGTLWYVYGSAEVIGLMMARIMNLPEEALEYAQLQGRAMQFINFIRDIDEDNGLGRCYFPKEEMDALGLNDLSRRTAYEKPDQFKAFVHNQLHRYIVWQVHAQQGFEYIPKKYRTALLTAVDMYNWTGETIAKNPLIVFDRKVKPTKRQVLARGAKLAVAKSG